VHLKSDPTGFRPLGILPTRATTQSGLIENGVTSRRPGYVTDILT